MENKYVVVLGAVIGICTIVGYFSEFNQVGFKLGELLGSLALLLLSYYLIQRGRGKKGFFDV